MYIGTAILIYDFDFLKNVHASKDVQSKGWSGLSLEIQIFVFITVVSSAFL